MKITNTLASLIVVTSSFAAFADQTNQESRHSLTIAANSFEQAGVGFEGTSLKARFQIWTNEEDLLKLYMGGQIDDLTNGDTNKHAINQSEYYLGIRLGGNSDTYYFFEEGTIQTKEYAENQTAIINSGAIWRLGVKTDLLSKPYVTKKGNTLDPFVRASLEYKDITSSDLGYNLEIGFDDLSVSYRHFPDTEESSLNLNFSANF